MHKPIKQVTGYVIKTRQIINQPMFSAYPSWERLGFFFSHLADTLFPQSYLWIIRTLLSLYFPEGRNWPKPRKYDCCYLYIISLIWYFNVQCTHILWWFNERKNGIFSNKTLMRISWNFPLYSLFFV